LTIERAKNAAPSLFREKLMSSVVLTENLPKVNRSELSNLSDFTDEMLRLTRIEEGEQWEVLIPCKAEREPNHRAGIVFICYPGLTPRFSVHYDIRVVDQKIARGSEVWMAAEYIDWGLWIPPQNAVSLGEWFDWRPIPEIEGPNSADAKLLGIPEHLGNKETAPKREIGRDPLE
jgi:hypothetical protein